VGRLTLKRMLSSSRSTHHTPLLDDSTCNREVTHQPQAGHWPPEEEGKTTHHRYYLPSALSRLRCQGRQTTDRYHGQGEPCGMRDGLAERGAGELTWFGGRNRAQTLMLPAEPGDEEGAPREAEITCAVRRSRRSLADKQGLQPVDSPPSLCNRALDGLIPRRGGWLRRIRGHGHLLVDLQPGRFVQGGLRLDLLGWSAPG
jgi:hypothetical protein